SGPGLERDFAATSGDSLKSTEIVAAAAEASPVAVAALARDHARLARALASVINVRDAACIVLGGGMSKFPRLTGSVSERLPRYVFSDSVHTRVVRNRHGDSSGVRGAAWLFPQN